MKQGVMLTVQQLLVKKKLRRSNGGLLQLEEVHIPIFTAEEMHCVTHVKDGKPLTEHGARLLAATAADGLKKEAAGL
jgi:hypothetical protein